METGKRGLDLLQAGDADGLRRLLEEEPGAADARDENGVSLLMQALYRGRRDLAELIAGKKTALDLFEAASLGRLEKIRELIAGGASINEYSGDGFTALHFAGFFGQAEAARLLIEAGAKVGCVAKNAMAVMPLHSAASARNLETVRLLLEHGAPANARQQRGWVALHAAAQNGDQTMVELLLRHGADPGLANDDGKTAAMVAREKGHEEVASLLEQRAGARS